MERMTTYIGGKVWLGATGEKALERLCRYEDTELLPEHIASLLLDVMKMCDMCLTPNGHDCGLEDGLPDADDCPLARWKSWLLKDGDTV